MPASANLGEARARGNSPASTRAPAKPASASEKPPEPPDETTAGLCGSGRRRSIRGTGGGLRLRRRGFRSLGRGRRGRRRRGSGSAFGRLGSPARFGLQSGRLPHLVVVADQNGVRRCRAGHRLHLLVVPAQDGICRNCAHVRLLGGSRAGHCSETGIFRGKFGQSTPRSRSTVQPPAPPRGIRSHRGRRRRCPVPSRWRGRPHPIPMHPRRRGKLPLPNAPGAVP